MNMINRRILRQVVPFAPLLAAATLSIYVAVTENDVAAVPALAAPAGTSMDANTLPPAGVIVPALHALEEHRAVSGSEPDPESFDQAGLEHWWHNYQLAHSMRAENSKR